MRSILAEQNLTCPSLETTDGLLAAGKDAAEAAGIAKPNTSDKITYGLYSLAKQFPARCAPNTCDALLRLALFDLDWQASRVDDDLLAAVEERLIAALKSHIDDDRTKFEKWFRGAGSSLIQQIAKQVKAEGGPLPREQVMSAMLELGWRSYGYVAQCVGTQMHFFRMALPSPLNDRETKLFDLIYQPQPFFANLPLLLLGPRLTLLKPAILEIMSGSGDEDIVGAIHRLLMLHSSLSMTIRKEDRARKSSRKPRNYSPDRDDGPFRACEEREP
jgi:hypothetical protein